MKNKQVLEVVQINKDYEFLMSFIGLGEIEVDCGVTYSENQLDALDAMLYPHLSERESFDLIEHIKAVKEYVDIVMDRMQTKVKRML